MATDRPYRNIPDSTAALSAAIALLPFPRFTAMLPVATENQPMKGSIKRIFFPTNLGVCGASATTNAIESSSEL
jgi:hypothetical protein